MPKLFSPSRALPESLSSIRLNAAFLAVAGMMRDLRSGPSALRAAGRSRSQAQNTAAGGGSAKPAEGTVMHGKTVVRVERSLAGRTDGLRPARSAADCTTTAGRGL